MVVFCLFQICDEQWLLEKLDICSSLHCCWNRN